MTFILLWLMVALHALMHVVVIVAACIVLHALLERAWEWLTAK